MTQKFQKCFLLYLNAQSVFAHVDEIRKMVIDINPVLICLSETHLTEDIYDMEIELRGYKVYRVDSSSRHTGGALIYVKDNFKIFDVREEKVNKTYWLISLKIFYITRTYQIVSLYRSPNSSTQMFLESLEKWCEEYIHDGEVLLTGDFNIDWLKNGSYSDKLKNLVHDMGLENVVEEITYRTQQGGTMIDLILTNVDVGIQVLDIPKIGDHRNITVSLKTIKKTVSNKSVLVRSRGRNIDFVSISTLLQNVNWGYKLYDINDKYTDFVRKTLDILSEVAPKRTVRILPHYQEWWNEKVKTATDDRDKHYKIYTQNQSLENWEVYKQKRNVAVKVMKLEKKKFMQSKIDSNRNNPKEMWKTLKSFIPTNVPCPKFDSIKFQDGSIETDNLNMCQKLNEYYVKSIETIVDQIPLIPNYPIKEKILSVKLNHFGLIGTDELKNIIFSLPCKGSPDDISAELLKKCFDEIANPLINIVNTSLELGVVPNDSKISVIVPVPKIPNTNEAHLLRPINMISTMSKIIEKTVYMKIIAYLESNNMITMFQSGFRSKHNCETALQYVINEWKTGIENNLITLSVFLDLQRAFETVDRTRLLKKLHCIGIDGSALNWMVSYLDNRKQITRINNVTSDYIRNNIGVPQGSILGPLLFLVYINDLVDVVGSCSVHLFADDALLYFTDTNKETCFYNINRAMEAISEYCDGNLLKINIQKTKWMVICGIKQYHEVLKCNSTVRINGSPIERVDKFKYLGVIIDRELKFKDHANSLIKTIAFKINYLRRCSRCLTMWSKHVIYNTLILPHFNYCSTILYLLNQNEIQRLQKMQNRAMRIILCCSRTERTQVMLERLRWLPIKKYLLLNALIFIFKIVKGLVPQYLQNSLSYGRDIHEYFTRSKDNIRLPKVSKSCSHNSIFVRGMREYNELPIDIKDSPNLMIFKRKLRHFFLN